MESDRVYIRDMQLDDLEPLLELRIRNRSFLEPFEPLQPESYFTLEGQRQALDRVIQNRAGGTGYGLGIFLKETGQLIGRVNLSNVVRGAWQNCTIGYFMEHAFNGKGLMTEAVRLAVQYAFEELDLHRVQAAVMPHNTGSIRVVEKVGFHFEGLAKYYLKINGTWEDHNIYSITRELF